jgi:hypothetical protein
MSVQNALEHINETRLSIIHRQNSETRASESNRTYNNEQRRFMRWVDEYPDKASLLIPDPGYPSLYLSTNSVNTYYLESMKQRCITRGTAEKAHHALNKLAVQERSPLAPDITKHPDTANVIETVLTYINDMHKKRKEQDAVEADPHEDNPTAIINQEELSNVMMVRLAKASNWLDCAVVWCISSLTGARFKSVQQLKTGKMIVIKNLPPHGIETPHDGKSWDSTRQACDCRMLGFLVPPYDQIKRPRTNKRQERKTECLGAYRHKRFERCMIGICGFTLLERLNEMNITFLKNAPNGYIKWNAVPLFERKYTTVRKTFKEAMAEAGVPEWGKVTHMRKAATTFLTAQGLPPDVVKMMTKHKVEVFIQSYICELSIPVCVCLAGFLPNKSTDRYFIPRSLIGLPSDMTTEEITNILFPERTKWITEFVSDDGDKTKGAHHFLFDVLPFLAEVVCQDGIFWVQHFPANPAVRQLLARLENKTGTRNYLDWARDKRKEVKKILEEMEEHHKTVLVGEVIGAPPDDERSGILYHDILHQRRELQRERMLLEQQRLQLNEREIQLNARELSVQSRDLWLRQRQEIMLQPFPPPETLVVAQTDQDNEGLRTQNLLHNTLPETNQEHTIPCPVTGTVVMQDIRAVGTVPLAQNNLRLLRTNANDAVKPTILSVNAYRSLENLVKNRQLHLHDAILHGKKMKRDDWANPKVDPNNWSRLKVLYQRIADRQRDGGETMEQAARWLDQNERLVRQLNLNQYLQFLKEDDIFGNKYAGNKRKHVNE